MKPMVGVEKDSQNQKPVPEAWRGTLTAIVEAVKRGDFRLAGVVPGVLPLREGVSTAIEDNLKAYGATLVSLPETSWDTSVCQWMVDYWDVLVDLHTETEGASDLVLFVRVREGIGGYTFDVMTIHVP